MGDKKPGKMSEWSNEPILKIGVCKKYRGFESLSFRIKGYWRSLVARFICNEKAGSSSLPYSKEIFSSQTVKAFHC